MQLSISQTQELLRIIDRNQLAVIGSELGTEFLTEEDKALLKRFGIEPEALFHPEFSSITTSFHFGMLAEALGKMDASKITYREIQDYVKRGEYIPVPYRQQQALQSIKMQTFSSLKSMGGNIFADVNNVLTNHSLQAQQQFIADEIKDGISNHKTVSQIAHSLAEKTGDWARNFDRIVETASQTAFEQGKAAEIQRRNEGRDPKVYKIVQRGACKHCIRLYLTNGLGSQPIIFKLSELLSNGSNIGRKAVDWLATVDSLHPHCRCSLMEYPEGYLWNTKTQRFDISDTQYKAQTAAKRPLIKVRIGEKLHYL